MSLSNFIPKKTEIKRIENLPENRKIQGHSSKEIPRCIRLPGVLTVEAAFIAPCLTFFFVSILFLFRVMQVQLEVQQAVDDTARKLAVFMTDQDARQWRSAAAVKILFTGELAHSKYANTYIKGGIAGVSLSESDWSGTDVELQAKYCVKCPIRFFGLYKLWITAKADCRKWSGWGASADGGAEDEEWVYITETGTVYHKTKNCTYLELSIQSADYAELGELRNESGSKYKKCRLCVKKTMQLGKVYITNQGDCYHIDLNCSGIKRTVRKIRRSETGGRSPCSRCKPA